ncbi:hypothetical protein NL676_035745 [Syzygium grande]|nr:hypothetical protein NL676_035745 [Syzygium grande]
MIRVTSALSTPNFDVRSELKIRKRKRRRMDSISEVNKRYGKVKKEMERIALEWERNSDTSPASLSPSLPFCVEASLSSPSLSPSIHLPPPGDHRATTETISSSGEGRKCHGV